MIIQTERFGELHIEEEVLIDFPEGILGFEALRQFVLVAREHDRGFAFLQSVEQPDLAFVVTDPLGFRPDYRPLLADADRAVLQWDGEAPLQVLTILTVPEDVRDITANLLAPVVIHVEKRIGRQVVQENTSFSTRHRIVDELARAQRLIEPSAEGCPVTMVTQASEEALLRRTV